MTLFLLKGLIRDRSRSLFPLIVVATGVMLTVFLHGWIGGLMNDFVGQTAHFTTGHVRVTSRAYRENEDQVPNDLAILGSGELLDSLEASCPGLTWVERIRFGGLLDIPDEQGETRSQGTAFGLGVDLLSAGATEIDRLNLQRAIVRGRLPRKPGEILISDDFAGKLGVAPGGTATLIGSTMYGGITMANFTVAGTLRFGIRPMDRGAMIADIGDVRRALDMDDAAGEILGYFDDDLYHHERAGRLAAEFNRGHAGTDDEFAPVMETLREQQGLDEYLALAGWFAAILVSIFVGAMSIVLWNVGLIGGLRRYGEIGVRLAIGESKVSIYRSMIIESILIGAGGSVLGTAAGLAVSYYLQAHGVDISSFMENSSVMMSSVIRTRVTPAAWVIGFIPGLFSTVLGTGLSGIGIFKRETAQLFKELEA